MKTKPRKKKPVDTVVSIRIAADVYQVISHMAEEENRTFGAMARLLIHEGLRRDEGEGRRVSASDMRGFIDRTLWRFAHPVEHEKMLDEA
jgi:hypothetical protein